MGKSKAPRFLWTTVYFAFCLYTHTGKINNFVRHPIIRKLTGINNKFKVRLYI